MQCEYCLNDYNPCKYNSPRQKYCTSSVCYRKRKALYARRWRKANPDYHREDSLRTSTYRRQKNDRRRLSSAATTTVREIKREFVSHLQTSANVLEYQLLTFLGLMSFYADDVLHTSTPQTSKRLQMCYKKGVILKKSDPVLTSYVESIYERITRLDPPEPVEETGRLLYQENSPPDI